MDKFDKKQKKNVPAGRKQSSFSLSGLKKKKKKKRRKEKLPKMYIGTL